jgi:hypothetical protein
VATNHGWLRGVFQSSVLLYIWTLSKTPTITPHVKYYVRGPHCDMQILSLQMFFSKIISWLVMGTGSQEPQGLVTVLKL